MLGFKDEMKGWERGKVREVEGAAGWAGAAGVTGMRRKVRPASSSGSAEGGAMECKGSYLIYFGGHSIILHHHHRSSSLSSFTASSHPT